MGQVWTTKNEPRPIRNRLVDLHYRQSRKVVSDRFTIYIRATFLLITSLAFINFIKVFCASVDTWSTRSPRNRPRVAIDLRSLAFQFRSIWKCAKCERPPVDCYINNSGLDKCTECGIQVACVQSQPLKLKHASLILLALSKNHGNDLALTLRLTNSISNFKRDLITIKSHAYTYTIEYSFWRILHT